MDEVDKSLVYSESVKAGKRIYYFDVKETKNNDKFIAITECKKIVDGPQDNPTITYEKHKIFLYKEDYDKFMRALQNTLNVARYGDKNAPNEQNEDKPSDVLNIELDF